MSLSEYLKMKWRLIFWVTVFSLGGLCALPAAVAQKGNEATALLDKAAAAYANNGGVEAAFHIDVLTYGGKVSGAIDGIILLKGSKFKLEIPEEMTVWFDGRNQWLYLQNAQEVNLSNPSEEELLQMNPVNVFLLYRHGFDARRLGEKTWKGKPVLPVVLTPQDKNAELNAIEVCFDKQSLSPVCIRMTNKDLSGSVVTVTRYVPGKNYPETMFVFPQKEYPTALVIDLR